MRENGSFGGTLVAGSCSLRVAGDGRPLGAFVDFEIIAGQTTPVRTESTAPRRIVVTIVDEEGPLSPRSPRRKAMSRFGRLAGHSE